MIDVLLCYFVHIRVIVYPQRSKDKYLYIWTTYFIKYEPNVTIYLYLQASYIATIENLAFGETILSLLLIVAYIHALIHSTNIDSIPIMWHH